MSATTPTRRWLLPLNAALGVSVVVLCVSLWPEPGASREVSTPARHLRRPVALGWIDGGRTLLVANQRSGAVSQIDAATLKVTGESRVGKRPSDLGVTPDGRVLITDEAGHELILLKPQAGGLKRVAAVSVPRHPVRLALSHDGSRCSVASLWSRRLTLVDLSATRLRVAAEIKLPFAPREQLSLPGGKLLVADSFGGQMAVVDLAAGRIDSVREVPFHNIRGLTLHRPTGRVLVSHQMLWNTAARKGMPIRNEIEAIPLKTVLDPRAKLMFGGQRINLDHDGDHIGAGDPAGLAVAKDGRIVVALAGIHHVALLEPGRYQSQRIAVGQRPTAVTLGPRGQRAYVANTFSDSITVIDLEANESLAEISLGPMPELAPSDRGELLFYDARLAFEQWMSCHTCHTDGHSNGLLIDTLGDGSYGTPKRVLSLGGVADAGPWAWNGTMKNLHDQLHKSVTTTMHGPPLAARQINDLAAFLHTLPPVPGVSPEPTSREDRAALDRGRRVFGSRGCANCHVPPLTYTTEGAFDVGLSDESGHRRFNPPSLRGVSQRRGWFHDQRAETLEEVFTRFGHQLKEDVSERELKDLIRFLRSL